MDLTPNLPAGAVDGDFLLAVCHFDRATSGGSPTIEEQITSLWTPFGTQIQGTSPSNMIRLFWKFWEPGDVDPTFRLTGGAAGTAGTSAYARIARMKNVDPDSPVDAGTQAGISAGNGIGFDNVPAFTPTPKWGDLVIVYFQRSRYTAGTGVAVTPGGWTVEYAADIVGGQDALAGLLSKSASGSSPGTVTITPNGGSQGTRIAKQHKINAIIRPTLDVPFDPTGVPG
jgi:hypothetical protein